MKRLVLILSLASAVLCGCAVNTSGESSEIDAEALEAQKAEEDSLVASNRTLPSSEISNPPLFKGKDASEFAKWVSERVSYPKAAADSLQRGVVNVSFVIDKEGNVVDAKIVKGVSYLLDSVALSIVSSSPQWTPGKNGDKPVQVSFVIPINFTLN